MEGNRHWFFCKHGFDDGLAPHLVGHLGIDAYHFVVTRYRNLFFEEANIYVENAAFGIFRYHVVPLKIIAIPVLGFQLDVDQLVGVSTYDEMRLAIACLFRTRHFNDVAHRLTRAILHVEPLEHLKWLLFVLWSGVNDQKCATPATCD